MPSPDKKRTEVAKRTGGYRSLASKGFPTKGVRHDTAHYTVTVQARISEDLADRVTAFANDHVLSPSETIRTLLEAGLEKESKQ